MALTENHFNEKMELSRDLRLLTRNLKFRIHLKPLAAKVSDVSIETDSLVTYQEF